MFDANPVSDALLASSFNEVSIEEEWNNVIPWHFLAWEGVSY